TLFGFVITAVFGFVVSAVMEPNILSIGASGGLFGLLGLSAGHGLRLPQTILERAPRMRTFGAAFSLLAFTAFDPESNVRAHVAGFVSGVAVGYGLSGRKDSDLFQTGLACLAGLIVLVAWWQAF
ncbi:MAG: rhomboid family intramembrane serine protease, partial [Deltaproteobacteria bacterium]|nr:rhomboid family intramembrane serine protease [Deltaproteobacteria bacterium]